MRCQLDDLPRGGWACYAQSVDRRQRGSIEWSAVAALAACVTAVAAMIVALTIVSQVRQETQRVLFNTGLDSLWHFDAQWNSDGMLDARNAAAAALLDGRPTHDIDAVLDFFDQIALLTKRGGLDEEMVSYDLYWPMANYWFASQEYVRQARRTAPHSWEHLEDGLTRMTAIEARRKQRTPEDTIPTKTQMRDFLSAEVNTGECAPDQEAELRQTPL